MSATSAHSAAAPGSGAAPLAAAGPGPGAGPRRRRPSLTGAVATTATRLLPLVALLDSIQPSVSKESVFRIRRKKIK